MLKKRIKRHVKRGIDRLLARSPRWRRRLERLARYILRPAASAPPPPADGGPPPRSCAEAAMAAEPIVDFRRPDPAALAGQLARYDVVSFDVFDTLVLRGFDDPKMIFRLWGLLHGQQYACEVRAAVERELRAETGGEVTLAAIYRQMERYFGVPAAQGMADEIALELRSCRPNPYMREVYARLQGLGVRIIITSDMYLPKSAVEKILAQCGYAGWEALYVSSDCQRRKSTGALWGYLNGLYPPPLRRIHVGDNPKADGAAARAAGWETCPYPNLNGLNGRPWQQQMAPLTGSLYRGLVNAWLYSGLPCPDPYYTLGFVYFGLPVFGYCQFVQEIAQKEKIGLVLFAARDMRAVWQVYREHGDTPCEYLPISRMAIYRADFAGSLANLLAYLSEAAHRAKPCTLGEYFETGASNLPHPAFLLPWLERRGLTRATPLNADTLPVIRQALLEDREQISAALQADRQAAIRYYRAVWERHGQPARILFADLNGRGTCLSGLGHLLKAANIPARLTGCLFYCSAATTRDGHYLDRSLYVYAFSALQNQDLYAFFRKNWSRITVPLEACAFADEGGTLLAYTDGHGGLLYGPPQREAARIAAVRAGAVEFARRCARCAALPDGRVLRVPGRDACWPLFRGARALDKALHAETDAKKEALPCS